MEVPQGRKHILNYFNSLKRYRTEEYRASERYSKSKVDEFNERILKDEKTLKQTQKELRNLSNQKYYGNLISLLIGMESGLEEILPVYKTAIGKSVIWVFVIVVLLYVPVLFLIYAVTAIALCLFDDSRRNSKSGHRYLSDKENRTRRKINSTRQEKLDFIKEFENDRQNFMISDQRRKQEISLMENMVLETFLNDMNNVLEEGLKVLSIRNPKEPEESSYARECLERDPILMFDGIKSKRDSKSSIVKIPGHEDEVKGDLLISEKSFYHLETLKRQEKLKGIDNKYKYSVYEFVVIYLSSNFLSCYRCYWDFLRGSFVDKEVSEYLYDSVVSVKTRERSSLNLSRDDERRIYKDSLVITTMDGRTTVFTMSEDRKDYLNSKKEQKYVSEIYAAAESIRYWLRQRRVDRVRVENIEGPE